MKKHKLMLTCLLLSVVVLAGCWPKPLKEKARKAPESITKAEEAVTSKKNAFEKLQGTKEYTGFLETYAKRENWSSDLQKASQRIADAKELNKQLQELAKKTDKKTVNKANLLLQRISLAKKEAKELSIKPAERIAFLQNVKKEAPNMVKKVAAEQTKLSKIYVPLSALAGKMKVDFPLQVKKIDQLLSLAKNASGDAAAKLKIVQEQFKAKMPDWALLGDSCKIITAKLAVVQKQDTSVRSTLAQLTKSYSKILVDQRTDFFIQVERYTWDMSSDWDTTKQYSYPAKKVDEDTFEYFDDFPGENLATISSGWSSKTKKVLCDSVQWKKLGINFEANWPRYHDDGTYNIQNSYGKYYHKYIMESDGQKSETDWVEVSAKVFEDNWDYVGMEIVSKPYGLFESEAIKEASPPGMSKVGNEKYGKYDNNGNWNFYKTYFWYHMMFGSSNRHYYSRTQYSNWNSNYRGQKAYFGSTSTGQSYGTAGSKTQKAPKFSNSTFAKTGGFKGATPSVRGAGSSARGRGPGGGGK